MGLHVAKDPIEISTSHNLTCITCAIDDVDKPAEYIVPRNNVYNTRTGKQIFQTGFAAVCQDHLADWYDADDGALKDIPPIHITGTKQERRCSKMKLEVRSDDSAELETIEADEILQARFYDNDSRPLLTVRIDRPLDPADGHCTMIRAHDVVCICPQKEGEPE